MSEDPRLLDDDYLDDDIPADRRGSFLGARNSQEVIASHLDLSTRSRLKHLLADLFVGPIYVRALLAFGLAAVLGVVSLWLGGGLPEDKDKTVDLCVLCMIHGSWLAFCAPMLLGTINIRLFVQIGHIIFRVFFAETAVMAYAFYRGHNNVFRRGFSLFPPLEANRSGRGLAWLGEAGYNLRWASVMSCCFIATVCTCLEEWAYRKF